MDTAGRRSIRRERFLKALDALAALTGDEAPATPEDVLRDARIKRFELCYETLWKLLQDAARREGVDASSPRAAFQAAMRSGVADVGDERVLWALIRYRNLTIHTYDPDLAREVERFVLGEALPLFRRLAARL